MFQIAEYVTFSMLIRIQYSLETLQGRGDIAKLDLYYDKCQFLRRPFLSLLLVDSRQCLLVILHTKNIQLGQPSVNPPRLVPEVGGLHLCR